DGSSASTRTRRRRRTASAVRPRQALGSYGSPPPRAAGSYSQHRSEQEDRGAASRAREQPAPSAVFLAGRPVRRRPEEAGDRGAPAVRPSGDAPVEDALDPVGMLLHSLRRLGGGPVDAVVVPLVRDTTGDAAPARRRARVGNPG